MAYEGDNEIEDLSEIISLSDVDFYNWRKDEVNIILPRLTEAGFTRVFFENGQREDGDVTSRVVNAYDELGNFRRMFYR